MAQLGPLVQGIRGEREVGRRLEDLRALGCVPFPPGEEFNVDHALVGPGGMFAIETKTISKRASPGTGGGGGAGGRGRPGARAGAGAGVGAAWSSTMTGSASSSTGGRRTGTRSRGPRRARDHVRDVLRKMTGRPVDGRPAVLYPGGFVTPQPRGCAGAARGCSTPGPSPRVP